MTNKVFIATSLDNYIADEGGGIQWLVDLPQPKTGDAGYSKFIGSIDAILMGRNTFEKVLSFGVEWPYSKKVFVWSNTIEQVPSQLQSKVELVRGGIEDVLRLLKNCKYSNFYIDGGKTIQSFMRAHQIHEITITQVPLILGKGIPLFQDILPVKLRHLSTEVFDNGMVQSRYEVFGSEKI